MKALFLDRRDFARSDWHPREVAAIAGTILGGFLVGLAYIAAVL